jgi:hypothetical protein
MTVTLDAINLSNGRIGIAEDVLLVLRSLGDEMGIGYVQTQAAEM